MDKLTHRLEDQNAELGARVDAMASALQQLLAKQGGGGGSSGA